MVWNTCTIPSMTIEMAVVYDHFQANLVSFKRIKKIILCCRKKRQEPFHSLSSPLTRSPESTFQALGGGLRLNKVGYFIIRHHHCNNSLNNARHAILLYTCFPYCKQICCIYIYILEKVYTTLDHQVLCYFWVPMI